MATVTPSVKVTSDGVAYVTWAGIVTGDTINPFTLKDAQGTQACVQISGTFGGATVALNSSNDNTTYFAMKDRSAAGTALSATAAAIFEFQTSALYVKPVVTAGAANSINVTLVLRG